MLFVNLVQILSPVLMAVSERGVLAKGRDPDVDVDVDVDDDVDIDIDVDFVVDVDVNLLTKGGHSYIEVHLVHLERLPGAAAPPLTAAPGNRQLSMQIYLHLVLEPIASTFNSFSNSHHFCV